MEFTNDKLLYTNQVFIYGDFVMIHSPHFVFWKYTKTMTCWDVVPRHDCSRHVSYMGREISEEIAKARVDTLTGNEHVRTEK